MSRFNLTHRMDSGIVAATVRPDDALVCPIMASAEFKRRVLRLEMLARLLSK
jgi:hypothetical protein